MSEKPRKLTEDEINHAVAYPSHSGCGDLGTHIEILEAELSRQSDHFATVCAEYEAKIKELDFLVSTYAELNTDITEEIARLESSLRVSTTELATVREQRDAKEKVVMCIRDFLLGNTKMSPHAFFARVARLVAAHDKTLDAHDAEIAEVVTTRPALEAP